MVLRCFLYFTVILICLTKMVLVIISPQALQMFQENRYHQCCVVIFYYLNLFVVSNISEKNIICVFQICLVSRMY